MDIKDKRILIELLSNSRIQISKLAKNVGVSREVALYRLNKLKRDRIILCFYTLIDTDILGYRRFTCFFQLKGISNLKEKKFFQFLADHKLVTYLGPVIGKWNVVFDLLAKDRNHLNNLVKEITDYIGPYIESYKIITTAIEQKIFPTKLLGIRKKLEYGKANGKIELDNKDLDILKLISINSRIEYVELSKKLKLTPNAIKYRLNNIKRSGVIKGYTISIDTRKLGYELYNIQIKLIESKKDIELKQFLEQHELTIYYYVYTKHKGWDLDVGVITRNSLDLRKFIFDLREHFGDILKIYDSYLIIEELKGNYAPEGIFENKTICDV